jgi:perosamine synthetase
MKMNLRYPVAFPHITDKDRKHVDKVLRSGLLSIGPEVVEFEKRFARYVGTKYACAVSNGTTGLHLTLIAAGIGEGDEVITSPFSFIASSNSIMYVGAKPVFVDIDPTSYNMDPREVEKKITKKTKALLVVHIFGQTSNMTEIMKIAKKRKLKVIEDSCESLGAKHRGKMAGTFGESAVFSFYPNKQMTTGEGGMIVTNSKKIVTTCMELRNQGRALNSAWLEHKVLGYNYRLNEMSATLGVSQLFRIDKSIARNRRIAGWYDKYLAPYAHLVKTPQATEHNTHSYFVYVVQILGAKKRDRVIDELRKRSIGSRPYLPSIHMFEFYRKRFGYKKGDFPISEAVSERSMALPIYHGLSEKDVQFIVKTLVSIL